LKIALIIAGTVTCPFDVILAISLLKKKNRHFPDLITVGTGTFDLSALHTLRRVKDR
jgi:hypothetical protein